MKDLTDYINELRVSAFFHRVSVHKLVFKRAVSTPVNVAQKACEKAYSILGESHTPTPETAKQFLANWLTFGITVTDRVHTCIWHEKGPNTFKDLTAHGPLFKKK